MRVLVALLVVSLLSSTYCEATFVTASHLLDKCNSFSAGDEYNNPEERICNGYIMGVHDSARSLEQIFEAAPLYCEPPRVTSDQLVLVVKRYLRANPELLHYSASSTVLDALVRAFPCD